MGKQPRFITFLNSWYREQQPKLNSPFPGTVLRCDKIVNASHLIFAASEHSWQLPEVAVEVNPIFSLLVTLSFTLQPPPAPSSAGHTFLIQLSGIKPSFYLFPTAKFHPFFCQTGYIFLLLFRIYSLSCTQFLGNTYQTAADQ